MPSKEEGRTVPCRIETKMAVMETCCDSSLPPSFPPSLPLSLSLALSLSSFPLPLTHPHTSFPLSLAHFPSLSSPILSPSYSHPQERRPELSAELAMFREHLLSADDIKGEYNVWELKGGWAKGRHQNPHSHALQVGVKRGAALGSVC